MALFLASNELIPDSDKGANLDVPITRYTQQISDSNEDEVLFNPTPKQVLLIFRESLSSIPIEDKVCSFPLVTVQ